MTPEEFRELQRLARAERIVARQARGARYADFRSDAAVIEEAAQRERLERHDQITLESVGHMVLFLRDLFRGEGAPYTWRGDGSGMTDHKASGIVIESCFSPQSRAAGPGKPTIIVNAGPGSAQEISVGNIKHYDFMRDVTTKTGLSPGTIQMDIFAGNGGAVSDLADFIVKVCVVQAEDLCYGRWHQVMNVTKGGFNKDNPLYARGASTENSAYCPVTLTYYYQWTARLSRRQDTASLASRSLVGVARTDENPDPSDAHRVRTGRPFQEDAVVYYDEG